MDITIYINDERKTLPVERIKLMLANGMIKPSVLGFIEGQTQWLPLSQIPQLQISSPVSVSTPQQSQQARKVGFWLLTGIVSFPYIFSWITLRRGYSLTTRIISFAWLGWVAILMICVIKVAVDNSYSSNQNTQKSSSSVFEPSSICLLPRKVAPNTPFAKLGGGTWGKWDSSGDDTNEGTSYGCIGEVSSINLKKDSADEIIVEYGTIGGKNKVHYLGIDYDASGFTNNASVEKRTRQQTADFCDNLSENLFGKKLPETFKKRLLDSSTYSPSGVRNKYAERVGNGYVNLSSNKTNNGVLLRINFYPSEEAYLKYKDS